ncbi:hypothetical protein GCM10010381_14330 [Streptomyces xantholiticus]|nr:hypothetical protein GCM10010381_14330 [Streptomyces xantholiticus]
MRVKVTVSVLFTAALIAGCGSGGDAKSNPGPPQASQGSPSAERSRTQAPTDASSGPLSADRLESAALSGTVDNFQIADWPARSHGGSRAEPTACQPVENMRIAYPAPAPKAIVGKVAYATSGPSVGSATTIGLMAYDQSGAERILSGLHASLEKCTSYDGGVPARTAVQAVAAPDAGDDALAFQLNTEGKSQPDLIAVVRTGATVVLFITASGTGAPAELPDNLVTAQINKLERISGGRS